MMQPMHPRHRTVPSSKWCVTPVDLDVFRNEVVALCQIDGIPSNSKSTNKAYNKADLGPCIYDVNEHYIKPVTLEAGGMSWALMRNPQGLECDVFASHCWAEGAYEFVEKIQRMWPKSSRNLFCCFLSIPQNGDVRAIVGDNPAESPFATALFSASKFLVVPNQAVSIYSRLWCVYELHLAIEHDLDIQMPVYPPSQRRNKYIVFSLTLFLCAFAFFFCLWHVIFTNLADGKQFQVLSEAFEWLLMPAFSLFVGSCFTTPSRHCAAILVICMAIFTSQKMQSALECNGICDRLDLLQPDGCFPDIMYLGIAINFVWRSVQWQLLEEEGNNLEFGSVRQAICSDAADQKNIQELISGYEDDIDTALRYLIDVGKFSKDVVANVERGMQKSRAGRGIQKTQVVAGTWNWVVVSAYVCVFRCDFCNFEEFTALQIVQMWAVAAFVSAGMLIIVTAVGDSAIFFTDALFRSGVCMYLIMLGLTWLQIRFQLSFESTEIIRGVAYMLSLWSVAVSCVAFYFGCLRQLHWHKVARCIHVPLCGLPTDEASDGCPEVNEDDSNTDDS